MIPILGIVGGIGSGKSAVADAMQKLGGHVIAADPMGHAALKQPDIKAKLVERWGDGILDDNGDADRKKVAAIVFADPRELLALEALVFPYIEQRIIAEIGHAKSSAHGKFIILDAAIMMETSWHRHCDKLVFVEAPRELRLARLKDKRGWSEAELTKREDAQMSLDEKKRRADALIVNDGPIEKVASQVQELLLQWNMI
jgi:dephospho-CoA kinase